MEHRDHIVRYDIWCKKCKHCKLDDFEEPCEECLENPINTDTKQPVMFEDKEKD